MIIELLQWSLLHLLHLVVRAEAWLTSGYKDIREQALAWIDFGLSLLPWPASAALAWLLQSGAKQHVGRAPTPPKSIAIILPDMPRNAAVTQSLAQCILWMAEAGLGHISVYDPQGTIKGAKSLLATRLRSLQKLKGAAGFTFAIQAGYPVAGVGLDRGGPEQGCLGSTRWPGCNGQNGHGHAPDQVPPGQPAPAHAVRIVLLSAEDSYAPILAAAVPGERAAKTDADGSAANGVAIPGEEAVSASRTQPMDSPGVPQSRMSPSPSSRGSQQLPEWISDLNKPLTQQRRTPSFRELKSRIEKPGEAESWGPIRRRARRSSRRPKFDWQHPFSSAVRWIAPDNSDSASVSASEDLGSSMQDHLESHDMHEGVAGNGSLSTCSSLPASEDAYALAEGYDGEGPGRHGNGAAFPAISEGRSPGIERLEPASHEAQWQRMAFAASEWAEKRNGAAPLPPLQNGNFSAAASPERQASPGEWPPGPGLGPGLPASRSEGLLSEWTRGSFGSHSGKLFGLEASYSSEDLLAAFQTELDRSPRKLAKASTGSSEASGAHLGQTSCRSGEEGGNATLTPAALNSYLEAIAGPDAVKEPELVLVFGEVLTLAAFPPWLLRFCEIYHVGHLAAFSRAKLHRILWRYCRTSQRFGK
ncbi:g236 [Coccomyxa viridis]|uniref:ditrans,polycis-polyprenyl diphosphate synthase [(2E,6E)-farnesyldiphosphate specific] n=1 Tax=Coccomyxa viridis TaxID=1274662 RepID=A0ABP1FLT6_9CHLO